MKTVTQHVSRWPELDSHGFVELAKVMRMMIILFTDKKGIVVFGILFSYFARRLVPVVKNKVYGFLSVVKVLSF